MGLSRDSEKPASPLSPDLGPKALVHVDLDGARHIYRAHEWDYPAGDDPLFRSGMSRILDLLERRGLAATFFVIAEDLKDEPKRELILEARDRGHELASHSLTHRHMHALDVRERFRELVSSREAIEAATGAAVLGFRAPGFSMDQSTLSLVADAGYRYDSSLVLGTRPPPNGMSVPASSSMQPLEGRDLVELPLPGYVGLPWPFHPSYSLLLGGWYFRLAFERFLSRYAHSHPFILLIHLTDLADPMDRHVSAGWRRRIYTISTVPPEEKLRRVQRMLDAVAHRCTFIRTIDALASATPLPRNPA